jgi:predicted PurR-regulated permease PerM
MRRLVLYALVLLGIYLSYRVLSPFFVALTWAAMFAILFRGMQNALARRTAPSRAALITTLVVGIVIVAPALVLISALAREAPQAIVSLKQASESTPRQLQDAWNAVRARSPVAMPEDPTDVIAGGTQRAFAYLAPRAGSIVGEVLSTLGSLAAMLFALFFFLRDGDAISRQLRDRLPFDDRESERLINDTRDLVMASVGASLAVAAAQGTIGGLAFWVLGLGAPVFWGGAMAFCSLLPVVGATLIWVPAAIWLLLAGAIGRGIAMLVVGTLGISMVDNILRPLLLSGRTSVNGLVIFFGLLGGAAAFGFVGLVVGPIILVITARLLEELRRSDAAEPSTPSPGGPAMA